MAIIQIKRSTAATAPTTTDLALAELAYAMDDSNNGASAKLYIEATEGGSAAIHAIGGKYFTDLVDAATDANTASAIVKRDGSGNFSAGTITADITGDVTGALTGNADTATSAAALSTARNIGGVSFDGSADINLPGVNTAGNQDTSGNAATATALETARSIAGQSFDGTADISVGLADLSNVTITTPSSGQVLQWNGSAWVNATDEDNLTNNDTDDLSEGSTNLYFTTARVDSHLTGGTGINYTTGTIDLADTTVTAGDYGSSTAVPQLTIDAQGRITAASTASISTVLGIAGDSGTDNVTIGSDTFTFSGTANEITTAVTDNTLTISLPDDVTIGNDLTVTNDGTVSGNLTVDGNLTVSGTTTTVDTTNLAVNDPLFSLATGNDTSDAVDIGFFGLYDTSGSQDLYTGLFRDATDGKWRLFKDSQTAPTTTVDTAATGYAVATLVANLEGNADTATSVSSLSGLDTDDLSEGSTNLYYTDARFDTRLASSTIDGGTY